MKVLSMNALLLASSITLCGSAAAKNVTVDLNKVALRSALSALFRSEPGATLVVDPAVKNIPVTVHFKNEPFDWAVSLIAMQVQWCVSVTHTGNTYYFRPNEDVSFTISRQPLNVALASLIRASGKSGLSVVVDPALNDAKVTASGNVPLDNAVSLVARKAGAAVVRKGNTFYVHKAAPGKS